MFCKNCGMQVNDGAAFCAECGAKVGDGKNFCASCGQAVAPEAEICANCGAVIGSAQAQPNDAPQGEQNYYTVPPQNEQNYYNAAPQDNQQYNAQQQYNVPPQYNAQPTKPAKSKMAAGLLGIFLGAWGIHNFYLGFTNKAIAQIFVSLCTCGVGGLWGFIEGILILTGSIDKDADGNPLGE